MQRAASSANYGLRRRNLSPTNLKPKEKQCPWKGSLGGF
jgi:hypothetical protein